MNKTEIPWALNPDGTRGYTWNPVTGCLNHIDGMCKGGNFPCYAYKLANTRLKERYLSNKNVAPDDNGRYYHDLGGGEYVDSRFDAPFYPRFSPEKMSCQFSSRKPQGIFVCSMSDLFGIGIPENWTWQVMQLIKAYPQHRFYLLTKQPQNLIKFSPFPDNCWVGVTATDSNSFDHAIYGLRDIEAKVKYLSIEPFLKMIMPYGTVSFLKGAGVKWLIIGACTGKKNEIFELCNHKHYYPNLTPMPYGKLWTAQPKIEWVKKIVTAADKAGVKVFLKGNYILDRPKLLWYNSDIEK